MSTIVAWFGAHEVALGFLIGSIVNFLIALNPNLQQNSLIHLLLSFLPSGSSSTPSTPSTPTS